jgi:hypothetical protein
VTDRGPLPGRSPNLKESIHERRTRSFRGPGLADEVNLVELPDGDLLLQHVGGNELARRERKSSQSRSPAHIMGVETKDYRVTCRRGAGGRNDRQRCRERDAEHLHAELELENR